MEFQKKTLSKERSLISIFLEVVLLHSRRNPSTLRKPLSIRRKLYSIDNQIFIKNDLKKGEFQRKGDSLKSFFCYLFSFVNAQCSAAAAVCGVLVMTV
jgi:hypothetical protein